MVFLREGACRFAGRLGPGRLSLPHVTAGSLDLYYFHFQNVISATKTTKEAKKNVIMSLAHEGIRFVEVASQDKIDVDAVKSQFEKTQLYEWTSVVTYNIYGALQEFRFTWDNVAIDSEDLKKRSVSFRLQSIEWEAMEKVMAKILKAFSEGSGAAAAPGTLPT